MPFGTAAVLARAALLDRLPSKRLSASARYKKERRRVTGYSPWEVLVMASRDRACRPDARRRAHEARLHVSGGGEESSWDIACDALTLFSMRIGFGSAA